MKLEYLIFNIIVFVGPLLFGSFQRFYFLDRWRDTLTSVFIIAVPFIIWDVLVTDKAPNIFEEVPVDEAAGRINIPGPSFDQLVSKDDVQFALVSLARLARQSKRIADALEKQTRFQKDLAISMRTVAVEIRKNKWN